MEPSGGTQPKTTLRLHVVLFTLFILSSALWIAGNSDAFLNGGEMSDRGLLWGFGTSSLFILWLVSLSDHWNQQYEEKRTMEREKVRLELWQRTWKGEPKIFDLLKNNEQTNDFQILIATISEFLDYCWFEPFVASRYSDYLDKDLSKRDLELIIRALDNGIIPGITDLNSDHRYDGYASIPEQFTSIYLRDYSLDILYTIAEFCGLEKDNGLEFYLEKLKDTNEKYADISDVPPEDNFVNVGEPNAQILAKCEPVGSAFDQSYEIRNISTFDSTKYRELEYDLARTLRCCICNILNTRLDEDIVLAFTGARRFFRRYENDEIKGKFLDSMIIEIWAICGGLEIEKKTYSDLRFRFSVELMQLEKDTPKSAFRTKKSTNKG